MMTIKIKNVLEIRGHPQELLKWCKSNLVMVNPLYEEALEHGRRTTGLKKFLYNYEVDDEGTLYVPRGVTNDLFSFLTAQKIPIQAENCLPDPIKINVSSKISLRDYQERFVSSIISAGSGIAVSPPGSGKTASALEVIARLGLKTLWLTHTEDLAKQTMSRIGTFLDVGSVGYIGAGKWKEGDITVALIQTLIRRDLSDIVKSYPLVIVDEVQHLPSESFKKVVKQFWSHYTIGLSATPYRKDGLEPLMFQVMGPKIAEVKKDELISAGFIVPATVIQRICPSWIPDYLEEYRDIIKYIHGDERRLFFITGDVVAEASLGNTCIVLTTTIDYGRRIAARIKDIGFDAELVYSSESIEVKEGKKKKLKHIAMPKKERVAIIDRFISGKLPILVATYKLLAEGFDYPPLSRLFLASPVSNKNQALIEQASGRVERSWPGKTDALVYDYVDNHSLLMLQAQRRIPIYEANYMTVIT